MSLYWFFFFFKKFTFFLFTYLWLCWVFVSVRGLSLVVASGDHSSSRCAGLSPSRPLLLQSTGSRRAGSAVVAHGPSCSAACGILPDQGRNPCPLHQQADSQPLCHQGSPLGNFWWYIKISSRILHIKPWPHIFFTWKLFIWEEKPAHRNGDEPIVNVPPLLLHLWNIFYILGNSNLILPFDMCHLRG